MTVQPSAIKFLRQMDYYFLIDSHAMRYDLKDPVFIKKPSIMDHILGQIIIVRKPVIWQCSQSGPVAVSEITDMILKNFDEYPTVWQAYDVDEMTRQLIAARSIEEVMAVFGP